MSWEEVLRKKTWIWSWVPFSELLFNTKDLPECHEWIQGIDLKQGNRSFLHTKFPWNFAAPRRDRSGSFQGISFGLEVPPKKNTNFSRSENQEKIQSKKKGRCDVTGCWKAERDWICETCESPYDFPGPRTLIWLIWSRVTWDKNQLWRVRMRMSSMVLVDSKTCLEPSRFMMYDTKQATECGLARMLALRFLMARSFWRPWQVGKLAILISGSICKFQWYPNS